MVLRNLRRTCGLILALGFALAVVPAIPDAAALDLPERWPAVQGSRAQGQEVRFATASPFSLAEVAAKAAPDDEALGYFFLPDGASADAPVPAVVMLHGAGGIQGAREMTYGAQFADMGIAALVIDVFGARRDIATGFVNRLINITESAMVTDAYAALDWLDAQPEVDADRVVLIGFSYGAMSTVFAAYDQVADLFAGPGDPRFAGHIAFYGPCIARFRDARTTGAPVLFLSGGRDAIVDQDRCSEIQDDLRRGGSRVENIVYPEGMHQWDGHFGSPRMIGRNLAPCRLEVAPDFSVTDLRSTLPMANTFFRKVILGLCAGSEGYMIGRDDAVRSRSNQEIGRFLEEVLGQGDGAS
ncbi:dienelactone hydrolase family protein [Marinibaculum pumilum]|uniref:Dienelactone hydrolase family protein n=1 Tax=Marinibaculum pumilum TaxID=1766165 RepID=A0ABV7KU35_9PROT